MFDVEYFAGARIRSEIIHEHILHVCYPIINVFAYIRITHGSFRTSLIRPLRSICNDRDPRGSALAGSGFPSFPH